MNPILETRSLSFAYPDGRQALQRITLSVEPGEKVGIVGPNGAGKSTLLLHLNGILKGEGEVWIGGKRLERRTIPYIRSQVGLVFQDPDDQLFSPTVFDDVAYGPLYMRLERHEVEARVAASLSAVGMTEHALRPPHLMSVGEKKLVAIATVLSMGPAVLAFDEPTAGLDARARRRIIDLIVSLPQTILVATHDLELVRQIFARTVVLDGGSVVADGSTADILSDERLLSSHGLV